MNPNDWQHIEDLFHAALHVRAEDRSAYLNTACAGDESLRLEVESLLSAFENESGFMEQPALSLGLKVLSNGTTGTLVGQTIGHYQILRLLGRGGMGEVYLAEDRKLNRNVALKFFTNRILDDAQMRRRLIKEARAVGGLEHPNICTVHGIEELDGYNFIIMQYVEGETLDSLMSKGSLTLNQTLELADQIVSALTAAHTRGIIHRDIKPQNIMVTADGQVKMLDFGLAKIIQHAPGRENANEDQSQFSQAGFIAGTVPYMSPEQLRAEPLDFRTDIFSVGVLLYELFSGKNPYKQGSEAETISAILTKRPPPLFTRSATKIPHALNAIICKCLEKDKEQRPRSAGDLLLALRTLRHTSARRINLRSPAVATAIIAVILLSIAGLSFAYLRLASGGTATILPLNYLSRAPAAGERHDAALQQVQTLVVLPLISKEAAPEVGYLGSGLTAGLVNQLSQLPGLRIKALSFVPGLQDGNIDPQQIGLELKADAVFIGKLNSRGGSPGLQIVLVNTADSSTLWHEEFDIRMDEIQTLPKEIAGKIALTLQPSLTVDEIKLLAKNQIEDPEAYRHYLLGRHFWDKRDEKNIKTAIDHFTRATEIAPLYALAWAGLAESYALLPTVAYGSVPTQDAMPKARAAARKALQIDDTLCEAHISLGVVKLRYEWNWQEAESEFKRAIELKPDNASAHYWYASLLAVTGRFEESIAESETAKELDPFSPLIIMNLGRAYYRARDYDKAITYFDKMLEENPNNSSALYVLGYVYLQKGMYNEAIVMYEKISATNKSLAAAPLGYTYAKLGRRAKAQKILREMDRIKDLPAQERAIVYIGLDDKDQAFLWLEKAYEERFASIISITSDPIFDPLRSDYRFTNLARKINLMP